MLLLLPMDDLLRDIRHQPLISAMVCQRSDAKPLHNAFDELPCG
jgi:hypothetical protein